MPLRGPYKQYEVDTRIAVPKSTVYDRRKRHFAEIDSDTDSEADQHDVSREHHDATLNRTDASGHEGSEESDAEVSLIHAFFKIRHRRRVQDLLN
jgi:hypothetical protein